MLIRGRVPLALRLLLLSAGAAAVAVEITVVGPVAVVVEEADMPPEYLRLSLQPYTTTRSAAAVLLEVAVQVQMGLPPSLSLLLRLHM